MRWRLLLLGTEEVEEGREEAGAQWRPRKHHMAVLVSAVRRVSQVVVMMMVVVVAAAYAAAAMVAGTARTKIVSIKIVTNSSQVLRCMARAASKPG